jgi:hypothetical protein
LPPLAGRLTSSVKCAFQFQRAEYLPEGGIFHRGDVDTAPFAVTSGDMTPESSESGINLRCGGYLRAECANDDGALQRLRKVKK